MTRPLIINSHPLCRKSIPECENQCKFDINMKKAIYSLTLLGIFLFLNNIAQAQGMVESKKKLSFSSSADASMFQLALLDIGGQSDVSTLRYSYFWNGGTNANISLSDNLTFFTGLSIKNLGFIIKTDTTTHKYRVYSLGVPVGLKIGKLKGSHLIVGGGVDFPFNYKVKSWENNRQNKTKSNEWFSNKVNPVMPYATIGARMKNSLTLKLLYYPTNFWNNNYYSNTNANPLVLTLGFDISGKVKLGGSNKEIEAVKAVEEAID